MTVLRPADRRRTRGRLRGTRGHHSRVTTPVSFYPGDPPLYNSIHVLFVTFQPLPLYS